MKTIITFIAIVMLMCGVNPAQALTGNEVVDYIRSTVPGASDFDAHMCAHVYINGSTYMTKSFDVTLTCSKNSIVKTWDRE